MDVHSYSASGQNLYKLTLYSKMRQLCKQDTSHRIKYRISGERRRMATFGEEELEGWFQ
jgi:hypothetical protein